MTLRNFIKENKTCIDQTIQGRVGINYPITNRERELWVLNDEYLYLLAKRQGARI